MSFIADASLALKLFGIIFVFYWVQSNVQNRLVAVLILVGVLYYLLFYAQGIFWIIIGIGLLMMFPGLNSIQDIYFQYGSAKELSARSPQAYSEEAAIASEAMMAERARFNTPYGPRWGRP
ncbi:MAG: hypothetical protein GXN93_02975 [Candidatus Diapherotrites archaeon]|nr:hypothetical protein [Candidatus Diapherotrites archaeon]